MANHGDHRGRQQKRLVADICGNIGFWMNNGRSANAATIAARQDNRFLLPLHKRARDSNGVGRGSVGSRAQIPGSRRNGGDHPHDDRRNAEDGAEARNW
jgi:hypothetical protein